MPVGNGDGRSEDTCRVTVTWNWGGWLSLRDNGGNATISRPQ